MHAHSNSQTHTAPTCPLYPPVQPPVVQAGPRIREIYSALRFHRMNQSRCSASEKIPELRGSINHQPQRILAVRVLQLQVLIPSRRAEPCRPRKNISSRKRNRVSAYLKIVLSGRMD